MRYLIAFVLALLLGVEALGADPEPKVTVVNNVPPKITVVNNVPPAPVAQPAPVPAYAPELPLGFPVLTPGCVGGQCAPPSRPRRLFRW